MWPGRRIVRPSFRSYGALRKLFLLDKPKGKNNSECSYENIVEVDAGIVGAWCSWCLFTAACMLFMIVLTAAEFAAVLQFLGQCKARGESLWKTFWRGGNDGEEHVSSHRFAQGMSLLWNLVLSVGIGVWLMISPAITTINPFMAVSNYIVGPLIISTSIISSAEVFRSFRYLNVLFGVECMVVSAVFGASIALHVILGIILIALAFPKGSIKERYGAWERLIY